MYEFVKAKPVWGDCLSNPYNQFLGFYTQINLGKDVWKDITLYIAARSYYRLFINGEMIANGPARTAKGYARVDEIRVKIHGKTDLAIEAAALDKIGKYCNDCTLEPGMLIVEAADENGKILTATGQKGWTYEELLYRKSMVETMSHSRGIVEYYHMNPDSTQWRRGHLQQGRCPICIKEKINFLKRRAPYPDYHVIPVSGLQEVADVIRDENGTAGFVYELAKSFNREWYEKIPADNRFIESLRKEKDVCFTGKLEVCQRKEGNNNIEEYRIFPGEHDCAFTWGIEKSELGFIEFTVEAEGDCTIDVINADHLHLLGTLKANTYASRFELEKGSYHLITFEPKLVRYVKFIVRSKKEVKLTAPRILDDSYPDKKETFFECSDGDLNRIYEGARRTLRLSTLDIFMDCPQRERGGWLCDSQFSAYAAYQLFGDTEVEKDFIENFMLTDGEKMWHGFFPEVYPGSKEDDTDPGIVNWSFWLLTELYAYYKRTGDQEFLDKCEKRVEQFVSGMLELRSETSGLLEGMNSVFVDWSLSNRSFAVEPISVPINCLGVYVLECMAELYHKDEWKKNADEMREIIVQMDGIAGIFGGGGDGARMEDGRIVRTDCQTESGVALEIWSGFHREDRNYISTFVNTMGVAPRYRANPNVGKANLFIGLMIRFDTLIQLGRTQELIKELRELYLDELRIGSGTFFENYNAFSGCHGFNGAAGAMLVNQVLGLGEPCERTKIVEIMPHPGELRWARGSAKCKDGMIYMRWSADQEEHELTIMLTLPEMWNYHLKIPFELRGWKITINGIRK